MKLSNIPLRASTGAFILNSGLAKQAAPPEQATGLHGMASTAIPQFKDMEPAKFVKLLSAGEIALAGVLLAPVVPARIAGLGLTAFSAGLMQLYMKVPGMRQEGTIKPSEQGMGIAKDVWMLAIGLALMLDGSGGGKKKAKKKAKAAKSAARAQAATNLAKAAKPAKVAKAAKAAKPVLAARPAKPAKARRPVVKVPVQQVRTVVGTA